MTTKTKTIPNGWQKKQIKDLLDYERPDKYIVESTNYEDSGTPVLTANKSFILGYTKEDFGIYKDVPVIIFDDFTTESKFVDFPFKVKSSAIKILKCKDKKTNLKFVYELIRSINFSVGNHKRYYISQYQNLDILVPPPEEQNKIAEILSSVDEDIKKTDEVIGKTEKLKKGLMQEFFRKKQHNTMKIAELANVVTGGTPKTTHKEYWGGEIPWMSSGEINSRRVKKTERFITNLGVENSNARLLSPGTVMIALAGQGKTRGKVAILEIETTCNQSLAGIVPKNKKEINNEFLFYNLEYRYKEIRGLSGGEGRSGLNLHLIKSIKIPAPSIELQNSIANIFLSLDHKIDANNKIKDKLTQLKRGLMRDLLSGQVKI